MYTLYVNKTDNKIVVSKASKAMQNAGNYTNEVRQYNLNYLICLDKKPLVEKAKEIRDEWIAEFKSKLEELEGIKF